MQSVWSDSVKDIKPVNQPRLEGDVQTDVLIVGAGMAGILTAHRLKQAGVDCVLAEARTAGSGVTKNTTAKITAQHGLIYSDMLKRFSFWHTKLYAEANSRAVKAFRRLSEQYPCDFEEKTAYVYSIDNRAKLEREAKAYQDLGFNPRIEEKPPLPFKTAGALGMKGQAQFNPLKLLMALADGLDIYENTFVERIEDGAAVTANGRIKAGSIVLATHYPLINIPGMYFMKLYQHRSYVVALEGAPLIDGMFVDEREDGHSFRTYKSLLFVGGGDHKTGRKGGGFDELRGLAKRAYPKAAERFAWATQDCMSLDGVPYIGLHRAKTGSLYVATGFNKWGMTGSMVASELLCDMIVNGRSELEELYSPQRSMLRPQLAANMLGAAAGLLSLGGPRCAHMGCRLRWNGIEGTWDCSCHGSRFDKAGHVIDNPAKHGIQP